MQVDYDATYLKEETEAQKKLKLRTKLINTHKQAILDVEMQDANDYEALTTLYRKIFRFLLEFAPNAKGVDRGIEREIAAALESVFPRVGLKAFIQLSNEEKSAQLLELARIILGIRLFNREEGRGGAGLDQMDKDSNILANVLSQDTDREVEFFTDACNKYQKAIVKVHISRRRAIYEAEMAAQKKLKEEKASSGSKADSAAESKPTVRLAEPEATDAMLERWSCELANRRQYLGFLRTLQGDTHAMHDSIAKICEKIRQELANVRALVNNKSTVPKETVYPRFDALGTLWLQLYEEVIVMIARSNTFQALCQYRLSFNPTLSENFYLDGGSDNISLGDEDKEHVAKKQKERADAKAAYDQAAADSKAVSKEKEQEDPFEKTGGIEPGKVQPSGATLLSVETSPDFMQLPLELQGYCPWTVVSAKGLLVPGRPAFGIVRFQNLYYVCEHLMGMKAFVTDPDYYLAEIKKKAMQSPEYIHLLRLQRWFPTANIAKLLRQHELEANNTSGEPLTKDASTSTPTHFNTGYIDLNYHWNEWELRRRALKLVNLRKCTTHAQQTDKSHFRRDEDVQVYDPRHNATQTRRDQGTNPPIVTAYVAGLRGKVAAAPDMKEVLSYADYRYTEILETSTKYGSELMSAASEKGLQDDAKGSADSSIPQRSGSPKPLWARDDGVSKPHIHPRAGVVTLTLDL